MALATPPHPLESSLSLAYPKRWLALALAMPHLGVEAGYSRGELKGATAGILKVILK